MNPGTPIYITTQTTTVVLSKPGVLKRLDFTAVANGVITIYDDITAVAANKIRTITSPGTILENEVNKVLDIALSRGCTIVTSGANQDIVAVVAGA